MAQQKERPKEPPEQFYVLVECKDEKEQVALLKRMIEEGLKCRALVS